MNNAEQEYTQPLGLDIGTSPDRGGSQRGPELSVRLPAQRIPDDTLFEAGGKASYSGKMCSTKCRDPTSW